jgi:hypothetical protein
MAYGNYFLGPKIQAVQANVTTTGAGGSVPSTKVGRVVKVSLDETVPLFDTEGNILPIGTISYRSVSQIERTSISIGFAIPLYPNLKIFPVENEIVLLVEASGTETQVLDGNQTTYYDNSGVINLWNTPHHNALPGQGADYNNPIGKKTPDRKDINPLYPFPGDILIEGRLGQSIRMGGYKSKYNILTDDSNQTQPFTIIRNGQIKTDNGIQYVAENINEDANSVYLLSNHKLPITPANTKRDSYNTPPTEANQYKGNQVVVNGGRLYFNAKEESILLSAKESVGLNAKTINLDGEEYMCLDADKIYLGAKARTSTESVKQPALLGKQFEFWILQLLETLTTVGDAMSTASAVGAGPVTQLNTTGPVLKASIQSLKNRISVFQSKKVYIE